MKRQFLPIFLEEELNKNIETLNINLDNFKDKEKSPEILKLNKLSKGYRIKCSKCHTTGVIKKYKYINDGICYKCNKKGYIEYNFEDYLKNYISKL